MDERIMSWERLLSSKRFGLERYHDAHQHTRHRLPARLRPLGLLVAFPPVAEQDAGFSAAR